MKPLPISCVIPARLNSNRFPKKLLQKIGGEEVIRHTIGRAIASEQFEHIFCFTDSILIENVLKGLHCHVIQTKSANNGTERIANSMEVIPTDLIVNLQGDEPCFPVNELRKFVEHVRKQPERTHIMTALLDLSQGSAPERTEKKTSEGEPSVESKVKVLLDKNLQVLDFKRGPIKDLIHIPGVFSLGMQMGVYGYNKKFLTHYQQMPPSDREISESHEMLRILPLPNILACISEEYSPSLDYKIDLDDISKKILSSSAQ